MAAPPSAVGTPELPSATTVGPPQAPSASAILDSTILPALRLAKAGVTGIGIPGVEPAINGVLTLATMLSVRSILMAYRRLLSHIWQTMKSNKEGLSQLKKSLDTLIAINSSGSAHDLKQRLAKLSSWVGISYPTV
jgi:hypothetical protein